MLIGLIGLISLISCAAPTNLSGMTGYTKLARYDSFCAARGQYVQHVRYDRNGMTAALWRRFDV